MIPTDCDRRPKKGRGFKFKLVIEWGNSSPWITLPLKKNIMLALSPVARLPLRGLGVPHTLRTRSAPPPRIFTRYNTQQFAQTDRVLSASLFLSSSSTQLTRIFSGYHHSTFILPRHEARGRAPSAHLRFDLEPVLPRQVRRGQDRGCRARSARRARYQPQLPLSRGPLPRRHPWSWAAVERRHRTGWRRSGLHRWYSGDRLDGL
jgi:hypothetical protein